MLQAHHFGWLMDKSHESLCYIWMHEALRYIWMGEEWMNLFERRSSQVFRMVLSVEEERTRHDRPTPTGASSTARSVT